jgi:hypothetical protein
MEIVDGVPISGDHRKTVLPGISKAEKELETGLTAGKIRIFHFSAGVAQLVEHFLAKEDVASSSLVTRFCPARADRRAISSRQIEASMTNRLPNSCRKALSARSWRSE